MAKLTHYFYMNEKGFLKDTMPFKVDLAYFCHFKHMDRIRCHCILRYVGEIFPFLKSCCLALNAKSTFKGVESLNQNIRNIKTLPLTSPAHQWSFVPNISAPFNAFDFISVSF